MEMEDPYDVSGLSQLTSPPFTGGAPFPTSYGGQPPPAFSYLFTPQQQDIMLSGPDMGPGPGTTTSGHFGVHNNQSEYQLCHNFNNDYSATTRTAPQWNNYGGFDGGAARWPRQETLTLLEIRARLDYKFKGATQKGPLWDELARLMCEEYGYQRSGKKCKEKFENLYKYYKKTKEGKAGRHDGKNYRFFRQLEALYGDEQQPPSTVVTQITENTPQFNTPPIHIQSMTTDTTHNQQSALLGQPVRFSDPESQSYSYDIDNSSSEDDVRRGKKRWKAKVKEFIDIQMREVMEKQESWVEKVMSTIESKVNERLIKGEEWRKQEDDRMDMEHKFWARERAWIEARDLAIMCALEKVTNNNNNNGGHPWMEHEVTSLIQVRTSMESRFHQCGFLEQAIWEDIATKMGYLGYNRSGIDYKEKWDSIKDKGKKKRKDNYGILGVNYQHNNHNIVSNNSNILNNGDVIYMNQLSRFQNCEINEPRLFFGDNGETSLG